MVEPKPKLIGDVPCRVLTAKDVAEIRQEAAEWAAYFKPKIEAIEVDLPCQRLVYRR